MEKALACPQCAGTYFVVIQQVLPNGAKPEVGSRFQCANCGMRVKFEDGTLVPSTGR